MPDNLIEKMARAMWGVYAASPVAREGSAGMSWDRLCELADAHEPGNAAQAIRDLALEEIRAALAAARVPTERMVEAGHGVTSQFTYGAPMENVWRAMIDAELGADPDAGG